MSDISNASNKGSLLSLDLKLKRGDWRGEFVCDLNWQGILGVAGRSGSGKTSLLRVLAGLERRVAGRMQLGSGSWRLERIALAPEHREIAMVFQDARLFPHLSVEDNLKLVAREKDLGPFESLISDFGVRPLLRLKPKQLSGGQQQRVALVRSLVNQPKMLLLDEPFSALDRISRSDLLTKLRSVSDNWDLPMLLVSHAIEDLCAVCDRVLLVQNGAIITHDKPMKLFSEPKYSHWFDDIAGAVLQARVEMFDAKEKLLQLSVGRQTLTVPCEHDRTGEELHIRIPAHEVILAKQPIRDSSLQNALACEVNALLTEDDGQVMCQLAADGQHLLASVTHRAIEQLQLLPGDRVYAHIKAMSLVAHN